MKKAVTTLVLGLILASLNPSAAAGPVAAFYGAEQVAFADWIEMNGRRGTFTAALGGRYPDADGGLVTIGAVARGSCTKEKGKHFTLVVCQAGGRWRKIPLTSFSMSPAMDTASLAFRTAGYKHKVRWVGRGRTPVAGGGVSSDDQFLIAGAGLYRGAKAGGVVFGRKMRANSDWDYGEMAIGGVAAAFIDPADDTSEISIAGNRFTVKREFRLPN